MTEQELAKIEARHQAASPPPWTPDPERHTSLDWGLGVVVLHAADGAGDYVCATPYPDWPEHAANIAFIAAAREDVPALVAEVRRLQAALHRDRTGLAAALDQVRRRAGGSLWLGVADSRGSYTAEEWDEAALRWEIGRALQTIMDLATQALAASGTLAHAADGCRDE